MPNLIKGLRYIKGNNLGFAMKLKGPTPVPNKGEKIRGGSLLTKSVLPIVDKFVFFQIFIDFKASLTCSVNCIVESSRELFRRTNQIIFGFN